MADNNRNVRQLTMRKINQSVKNIDTAMQHMNWVGDQYAENYPKQTMAVSTIFIALKMCRDLLEQSKGEF